MIRISVSYYNEICQSIVDILKSYAVPFIQESVWINFNCTEIVRGELLIMKLLKELNPREIIDVLKNNYVFRNTIYFIKQDNYITTELFEIIIPFLTNDDKKNLICYDLNFDETDIAILDILTSSDISTEDKTMILNCLICNTDNMTVIRFLIEKFKINDKNGIMTKAICCFNTNIVHLFITEYGLELNNKHYELIYRLCQNNHSRKYDFINMLLELYDSGYIQNMKNDHNMINLLNNDC
jgi:hypothetical protein